MQRFITLCVVLSLFLLNGCVTETSTRIRKASMEVNPAPEMRGAGEHLTSSYRYRFSGNVNVGKKDDVPVEGMFDESRKVDFETQIRYGYVSGSAEVLTHAGPLMFDLGVGVNSGLYTFLSLGLNTRFFEIGASAGLWNNFRKYHYEGYTSKTELVFFTTTRDLDETSSTGKSFMAGLYTGLYFGPISLEASVSYYGADFKVDDVGFDVLTTYLTANYHLNEHWTIRAGAVRLYMDMTDCEYWSGFGGVSYSL